MPLRLGSTCTGYGGLDLAVASRPFATYDPASRSWRTWTVTGASGSTEWSEIGARSRGSQCMTWRRVNAVTPPAARDLIAAVAESLS